MSNEAEQVKTKWLIKEQGEDARWVGEGEVPTHGHDQFMAIIARAAVLVNGETEQTVYLEVTKGYGDHAGLAEPRSENPHEVEVQAASQDLFDQSLLALLASLPQAADTTN